jgi:hypothetical protein
VCKRSMETIDHLLLYYKVARELWVVIFHLFGIEWVLPRRRVVELLASLRGQLGNRCILESWNMAEFQRPREINDRVKRCFVQISYAWLAVYNSHRLFVCILARL